MNRLKLVMLLLVLALLPLRGLTAVTIGDCAVGQHGAAHQHDAHDHDHGSEPHSHDDAKHDHEHCASASFVAPAIALPLPIQASPGRVAQRNSFAAGFVADPLDPPPLAL